MSRVIIVLSCVIIYDFITNIEIFIYPYIKSNNFDVIIYMSEINLSC